jgi:hypothetical protein
LAKDCYVNCVNHIKKLFDYTMRCLVLKIVQVSDATYAELVKLTGNLQAITREVKSFDHAIKILVDLEPILTDHELG